MSHLILFRVNCCWGVAVVVWQLDLKLPVQSVPITTIIESSNPVYADVYLVLPLNYTTLDYNSIEPLCFHHNFSAGVSFILQHCITR
jgi:hypothetical protein